MLKYQLLFCFVAIYVVSVPAQDAASLLSQAVYEEEINGDLQAAVGLYSRVVEEFPGDRPVAAEALLRIGIVHEKMGRQRATEYYLRVIDDYSDQTAFVRQARDRLRTLHPPGEATGTTEQEPRHLQTSKVFSLPAFYGSISPDGRYFSYCFWETGDLALYDIQHEEAEVIATGASWSNGGFCDRSIWSPDSRKVAFCWIDKGTTRIRTYDLDTRKLDTLTSAYFRKMLWPIEWTSDGNAILASLWDRVARRNRIVFVDAQTGALDTLLLVPARTSCDACNWTMSNDGQWILYDKRDTVTGIVDIYLRNLDGTIDRPMIVNPAIKHIADWTPDNSGFLYYSDVSGYHGLWKAELDGDLRVQATRLLLEGLTPDYALVGVTSTIGMTDNGIYHYSQWSNYGDIFTVEFDPVAGILEEPEPIPSQNSRPRLSPFWSPNGDALGYWRKNDPALPPVLEILDISTGEERQVTIQGGEPQGTQGEVGNASWLPDNRILMTQLNGNDVQIVLTDPTTGDVQHLLDSFGPKIAGPDGSVLYADNRGRMSYVVRRQLDTLLLDSIYATPNRIDHLALSPDAMWLTIMENLRSDVNSDAALQRLELATGAVELLWQTGKGTSFSPACAVNWLHDNRTLLVSVTYRDISGQQLYLLDTQTGARRTLGEMRRGRSEAMRSIRIHPSEDKIVFGIWQEITHVWALENY